MDINDLDLFFQTYAHNYETLHLEAIATIRLCLSFCLSISLSIYLERERGGERNI